MGLCSQLAGGTVIVVSRAPMSELPPVADRFSALALSRTFRRLTLRQRVALSQLPLSVVVMVIAGTAPVLHPGLLEDRVFQISLVLHAALLISCFAVPWERLRSGTYLIIPLLDFLAIGVSREGASETLAGLGLLTIFPVIWLSASGLMRSASVIVSFAASWLVVLVPVLAGQLEWNAADITATLLLPVAMLTISLSIRFASVNLLLQQAELKAKDAELRSSLEASNGRERLMKAILDTVGVGVVAIDPDGECTLTNRQQHLFQELAAPDEGTGSKESGLLIFGRDRKTLLPSELRPLRRAINGETYSDYLVWLGEGTSQRAVSVAAKAVMDGPSTFQGSVIVFNDVTELVEAVAAKDDFVWNVSHEFRTPLTSILGYLDLALDGKKSPAQVEDYLETARRNAERLLTLVSDLLLTASGSLSVHPRPTELSELVEASIRSARAHSDKAGIIAVNEVPDPLWAYADPTRLGQVLDNLLSNAIKYSPNGGLVTVRGRKNDEAVEVEVQDTGMGMTEADADRVFSRFFRASAARQSAIPGAGLGLAITKSIVESHGGTIFCASAPGTGTTFTVTLPANPSWTEHSMQEQS